MGEILADATRIVVKQKLLSQLALIADDYTGPLLARNGTWKDGVIGRIEFLPARLEDSAGEELDALRTAGWFRAVDDPAQDGSVQLNIARLARLLDVEETVRFHQLDPASFPVETLRAMAVCTFDAEDAPPAADLTDQVDRIRLGNPRNVLPDWEESAARAELPASWAARTPAG